MTGLAAAWGYEWDRPGGGAIGLDIRLFTGLYFRRLVILGVDQNTTRPILGLGVGGLTITRPMRTGLYLEGVMAFEKNEVVFWPGLKLRVSWGGGG